MDTKNCPACDGTGICLVASHDEDRNDKEPCMYCDGDGEIREDE
jgi:DnaJ-class molecular chaperone